MRISETFYSIQGEGTLTGLPSVFIRTAGCNLHCRWCDSTYASLHSSGREWTIDALAQEVNRYSTRFCVITGGEPMLAEGIHDLAKRLADNGKHVTIETAATIPPQEIDCSLASISPKLANSTPGVDVSAAVRRRHEAQRLRPDVIRDWIDHYDYQLKFVVCSGSDIAEVIDVLNNLHRSIAPEKVLLMPEGVDTSAFLNITDQVIAACKEHGFRFCDRLHIRLYGNERRR
ncbi:MAG: 7-carboxy-7-deazaguanine synthase QueE [Syntrophales bacterium]|jgi:7-carboxy-7-deazaguanine synthase|nr:7-carboxy-7-deazaguanine synthase QueE [Syntrophales bacterium]